MATVLYTSTERIRAVLGVTVEEIEDSQILDLGVDELLEHRLVTVYPDHAALAAAIDAGTATTEEQATWLVLKLYCRYEGACFLLPQLPMLVAQKISDGDAEMQRFSEDTLEKVMTGLLGKRDEYLLELNPLLITSISDVAGGLFNMVPPGYDPVVDL